MNKPLAFGLAGFGLCLAAPALQAQEVGRVISSVPMIQQVAVPRQVCNQQPVVVEQPRTGAGAVLGAVAGGAAGNAIGGGSGRALATIAGVIGGAMLGNNIEGSGAQVQQTTQCTTQTYYENRAVGYNVTYEYAGRQYTVQMPQDPGPTIPLQVVPVGAGMPGAPLPPPGQPYSGQPVPAQPAPVVSAPIGVQPAVVVRDVVAAPVYYGAPIAPVYYRPYYYPVVPSVSLNFGYVHGGHRHWR